MAAEFLAWLGTPRGERWLDIGCGAGALSEQILRALEPARVASTDASITFVEHARRRLSDPRACFAVAHAQWLPARSGAFDRVVSGLVLNFLPDLDAALIEMTRVVHPGGGVAAYVWDYSDQMQLLRFFWDAAVGLDPSAERFDEGLRFPICRPDRLEALFRRAGLEDVESRAIDVATAFGSFDDYWSPFLGGQGPAPAYALTLSEEHRGRLRERLRAMLPTRDDGSIELVARAWAVRGTKAGRARLPA